MRTRFSSEAIELDHADLAASLQTSIFGESHIISAMGDEMVQSQLSHLKTRLAEYDENCFAALDKWDSSTGHLNVDDSEEWLELSSGRSGKETLRDSATSGKPGDMIMEGSLDKMLQWMNSGTDLA